MFYPVLLPWCNCTDSCCYGAILVSDTFSCALWRWHQIALSLQRYFCNQTNYVQQSISNRVFQPCPNLVLFLLCSLPGSTSTHTHTHIKSYYTADFSWAFSRVFILKYYLPQSCDLEINKNTGNIKKKIHVVLLLIPMEIICNWWCQETVRPPVPSEMPWGISSGPYFLQKWTALRTF